MLAPARGERSAASDGAAPRRTAPGRRCRRTAPPRRCGRGRRSAPASRAASATAPPGSTTSLRVAKGEGHRAPDVLVGGREAAREQAPVELEGQLARRRRQQRVADRAPSGRVARGARPRRASARCRRSRRARPRRPRCPGQSSASARPQPAIRPPPPQGISAASRTAPSSLRLLGELEPGGALAGDDPRIVVGPDQRRARCARRSRRRSPRATPAAGRRGGSRRPAARVFSTLIAGASAGITMVAGLPSRRAAAATPWAWLPDE